MTLKNKPSGGQFFTIPEDKIFKKGDHLELLELILNHHIFPEIYIVRTSTLKRNLFKHNELAYWAFTRASDYLSFGDIIFLATPFYLSTTFYFDDEVRTQAGHEEVEYAWDRYRGGLEYFSSNICQQLDNKNFDILQKKINAFVIQRMLVGLRIRIQKKRNPVDNYYLARRLCGLGQKSALPVNYDQIRSFAALWDLGNNPDYKNIETIIIVGDELSSIADHVRSQTTLPVLHLSKHVQGHRNCVFLFKNLDSEFQADMDAELLLGNIFLKERMLMEKFR